VLQLLACLRVMQSARDDLLDTLTAVAEGGHPSIA
jgi:hypothetical protein